MIDAAQLFLDSGCAGCHGADGAGIGNNPDIRGKDADAIRNAGGIMPNMISDLSEAEIDALGEYISEWEVPPASNGDAVAGATKFTASCAGCHGADRSGSGPYPSITASDIQTKYGDDFDSLVAKVFSMTNYGAVITEDEAKDVAAFLSE